jgi:hypothetical protein
MTFKPETSSNQMENPIDAFPDHLAEEARTVLARLQRREISPQEARSILHGSIDAAINSITGGPQEEEEPEVA